MSLSLIFSGANLTMRISEYLKLTTSMSYRIARLEKMHQKAAKESLESAYRTADENLQRHYILRAIDKYHDAIGVEEDNVALFGIYVGLACCQGLLNDISNRNSAIHNALKCYEAIKAKANKEPESFFEIQADYDEGTTKILKFLYGVSTLGVANLLDKGSQKVQQEIIQKNKERKREMRNIAETLQNYI